MTDNEIICQLRNFRKFQRDQLSSRLNPAYIEGRKNVLRDVSEQLVVAEEKMNALYLTWDNLRYKWFSNSSRDEAAAEYRVSKKNFETIRGTREDLLNKYESTCDYNVLLKQFDIETERMILAHICNVELICGQKMLVSDSTE